MNWLAGHAKQLVYINLGWSALLTVAFLAAKDAGHTLYFLGATILTVGVVIMK